MEPNQIITIGLAGLTSAILLTGLIITHINKNRNSTVSDRSGSESSRDSDSSYFGSNTINNASFSENDMTPFRDASISDRHSLSQPRYEYTNSGKIDEKQFHEEKPTDYNEGFDLPSGGKKTKRKTKTKTKEKKRKPSKKNKKL